MKIMYKCEICGRISRPREPCNRVYSYRETSKGTGKIIASQKKACWKCFQAWIQEKNGD